MTAICGLWRLDGDLGAAGDCEQMRRSLAIYGRDRSAGWDDGDIALGLQLARLVPEDVHDRQPLTGCDDRFVLVFDGRIDNRPELAVELEIPAERARSMADSAFVLAAWERWDVGSLERLVGDYALAVWDRKSRTLRLARDPMGQRPLFYHQGEGFVAFATMAKGLHALSEVPVAPDLDTLRDYLVLAPMRDAGSFFAGIRRVEPGELVTLHDDGRVQRDEWYEWRLDRQLRLDSDEAYVEAFRALFDRCVADRLRAAGPIASQLSGGFDSGAVTATAARLLAARNQRLAAFTHVPLRGVPLDEPPGRHGDEGPLAATVAALYPNVDHIRVDAAGRQIGDDLDAYAFAFEHPALNLCNNVWMSEIGRRAGRQADVMLTGARGNMTISLSGEERLTELFWSGDLATWFRETNAAVRAGHRWLGAWLGRPLYPLAPHALLARWRAARAGRKTDPYAYSALRRELLERDDYRRRLQSIGHNPHFTPRSSVRSKVAFVLRRFDIFGMVQKGNLAAYGLDVRDPTCDIRLVEFILSAPPRLFFREGRGRWLYHAAFIDRISPEVLRQKGRGYQAADWAERMRSARGLLADVMGRIGESPTAAALLEVEDLERLATETPSARPDSGERLRLRLRLLRGLSVGSFVRRLDASNGPERG